MEVMGDTGLRRWTTDYGLQTTAIGLLTKTYNFTTSTTDNPQLT